MNERTVEILLRKYLRVADLVVTALCAFLVADAAIATIRSKMRPPPLSARHGVQHLETAEVTKQLDEILSRNIFCSTCASIARTSTMNRSHGAALPLRLLAIMYAPPPAAPRWSVAVVSDRETHAVGAFSVGSRIRDGVVDRIDETRISIDRGGGWREVLDLISSPAVTAPGISPAAADGDGVTKIGEHSYCVRRAALDSWLSDPAALMTAAVIVPEARDGKPTAIRLVRIRPGSVLERIGLRGGDLIRAVNGLELATPDGALQAFLKLRSSAHIAVSIERGGQPLTQEYSIE